MTPSRQLLTVGVDDTLLAAIQQVVALDTSLRLRTAADAREALGPMSQAPADVWLVSVRGCGMPVADLVRGVRTLPGGGDTTLVLVVTDQPAETTPVTAQSAIDDVWFEPLAAPEIRLRLRHVLRARDARLALQTATARVRELDALASGETERLACALGHIVELRFPGALNRARAIVDLSMRIFDRFRVPEQYRRDLELAGRLQELGRVALPPHHGTDSPAPRPEDRAHYIPLTAAVLERASLLPGVLELILAVNEHWDGTGQPEHFVQGQIPLRGRILRVVVDFVTALDARLQDTQLAVLSDLESHRATRYDPVVLAHLRSMLERTPEDEVRGTYIVLPLEELRSGMVLASDIYTDAGIKLLTKGVVLTQEKIESLLRRHQGEPIHEGVAVDRHAA